MHDMHDPDITQALVELSGGDRQALDRLLPAIYDQLHAMAQRALRAERPDHTLSPTDLVHEAYLGLATRTEGWGGRTHFLCAAAQAMRDHGVEPFLGIKRGHGWAETYIHPKDSGGVLFQFYVDEDHEHEHEPPK